MQSHQWGVQSRRRETAIRAATRRMFHSCHPALSSLDRPSSAYPRIYTHKLGWLRVPARSRRQAGSHKQVSGRGALPQRSQQTPAGCPKGRAAHNQRSHGQTSEQAEESWAHRQRINGCMHAEAWHAWVGWVRLGGQSGVGFAKGQRQGGVAPLRPSGGSPSTTHRCTAAALRSWAACQAQGSAAGWL